MYRNTYVKIDESQIEKNVKEIINKYNSYKYFIGVVKANAYGHGFYIVNNLIKAGINYLAVSSIEEALEIRKYNNSIPILVLEPVHISDINIVLINNITITVESFEFMKNLNKIDIKSKLNVHIKLDTGMNRLGFKDKKDLEKTILLINKNKKIYLEGIYTHIATSGLNDKYYKESINQFKYLTQDIDLNNIPIVHINRSITLVHHKKLDFETGVRLGIIMYGFSQSMNRPSGINMIKNKLLNKNNKDFIYENNLSLKTAFSLYSEVMNIKKINKGEYVGYGAKYIANKDTIVATIPIGYYDGVNKDLKYVCISGKKYKIIGEICMDMFSVEVDENVKIFDEVEIFGNTISIKEAANNINKNAYHLLTGITTRVPRVYNDNTEIKY